MSTRRFLKPRSPLFHTTLKYKGNLWHWITKEHVFNRARKKIVYTRLTTLLQSVWNSFEQLTSTRAVLYIYIICIYIIWIYVYIYIFIHVCIYIYMSGVCVRIYIKNINKYNFFFKFWCHGIWIQNGQASCRLPHLWPTESCEPS